MVHQGSAEATGKAKITKAYNLPCKYVIHTVGPIVRDGPTKELEEDLRSCYQSCLTCAADHGVRSIAFCCISTGEFHFPQERAAEIAVESVLQFLNQSEDEIDRVIFNVFQDLDYKIYNELLGFYKRRMENDK
jgi:O-acetyl-ADP-ribose deacetylase (regulator of RNase III)